MGTGQCFTIFSNVILLLNFYYLDTPICFQILILYCTYCVTLGLCTNYFTCFTGRISSHTNYSSHTVGKYVVFNYDAVQSRIGFKQTSIWYRHKHLPEHRTVTTDSYTAGRWLYSTAFTKCRRTLIIWTNWRFQLHK